MARLGIAGGGGGMGTDSVSVPRSIIDQYEELKSWPDDKIESELHSPTGLAPEYLVFSEARRRMDMRERYENESAGQNLPQVSMVEELLGGGQPGPPQAAPPPPGGPFAGEQALPGGGGPPMMDPMMDPMMAQGPPPMAPPGAPPMMDPMMMPQGESRGDLMPPPGYAGGGLLGRVGYAAGGPPAYSIYGDEDEYDEFGYPIEGPMQANPAAAFSGLASLATRAAPWVATQAAKVPWGKVLGRGLAGAGAYHEFGTESDQPKINPKTGLQEIDDEGNPVFLTPWETRTPAQKVGLGILSASPLTKTGMSALGLTGQAIKGVPKGYRATQSGAGWLDKLIPKRFGGPGTPRIVKPGSGRVTRRGGVDPKSGRLVSDAEIRAQLGKKIVNPTSLAGVAGLATYFGGAGAAEYFGFGGKDKDKDAAAKPVVPEKDPTEGLPPKAEPVEKTEDYIKFLKGQFGKPDDSLALAMIEAGGTMANTTGPPISAITAGVQAGMGVYTESQQITHKNKLASALALQEDAREYEKLDAAERQATTKMRFKAASDMEESLYKMVSTSGQGAEVLRPMMDSNAKWKKMHPDGGSPGEFIEFMKNQAYWFNAGSQQGVVRRGPLKPMVKGTVDPISTLRGAKTAQQGGLVRGRLLV